LLKIYPGGGGIPQALPPNAPAAFLLVADDDDHTTAVLKLFTLYRAAKIPVEVHVFTRGQHAFGMGSHSRLTTIKDWPERLADWMGDNNILNPPCRRRRQIICICHPVTQMVATLLHWPRLLAVTGCP